jgi:hypothetical protein
MTYLQANRKLAALKKKKDFSAGILNNSMSLVSLTEKN